MRTVNSDGRPTTVGYAAKYYFARRCRILNECDKVSER